MLLKLEDVVERLCHEGVEVTVTEVRHFVEQGWVLATKEAATHRFDDADLARVKLIHELRQDMAVNDEAVPIVLRLLDQIYGLREVLDELRLAIQHLPPGPREELERRVAEVMAASGSLPR